MDTYRRLHGKTMFTTDEVAEWALASNLWPVPKRGDDEAFCEAWEHRLECAQPKTGSIRAALDASYDAGGKVRDETEDPDQYIKDMRGE